MRNKILLLVFVLINLLPVYATSVQTVRINFDPDKYYITYDDETDIARFHSKDKPLIFKNDSNSIGLPFVRIDIALENYKYYIGHHQSCNKTMDASSVYVLCNPSIMPSSSNSSYDTPVFSGGEGVYPSNTVEYVGNSIIGEYNILHFNIYPFEFNTIGNRLFTVDSINLSIDLGEYEYSPTSVGIGNNIKDGLISNTLFNPEDFQIGNYGKDDAIISFEYVIITNEELANSFKPLSTWKKKKGLRPMIKTLEDIYSEYNGSNPQEKIKAFITQMVDNHNTKFVLLGGDDTVVPAWMQSIEVNNYRENIPADIYYATLHGDWENSLYIPSVYVTRTPVNNSTDVNTFCTKVINYEKNPDRNGWSNNILIGGRKLFNDGDAEIKGNMLSSQYMAPHWNGSIYSLYDTSCNLPNGTQAIFNRTGLHTQLGLGYNYVSILAHGNSNCWEQIESHYYNTTAESLTNNGYTNITTMSCLTNAFDLLEPCLSEAFIRNPNSGVVSYFGSSRYGWDYRSYALGPSLQFEAEYYKELFREDKEAKNFGKVASIAKSKFASSSKEANTYKWLQMSINPIGDPEMPLYSDTPKKFANAGSNNPISSYKYYGSTLRINTGVDSCTVCVMGADETGTQYYQVMKNVRVATFNNVSGNVYATITKPGYAVESNLYFHDDRGDGIIIVTPIHGSMDVQTLTNNNEEDEVTLTVYDENGNEECSKSIQSGNQMTTTNFGNLNKGRHIVSLKINGIQYDSKQAYIK